MKITSRRPTGINIPVKKQEVEKVEKKKPVREKKVVKKEEEIILPLVEEALASIEE